MHWQCDVICMLCHLSRVCYGLTVLVKILQGSPVLGMVCNIPQPLQPRTVVLVYVESWM